MAQQSGFFLVQHEAKAVNKKKYSECVTAVTREETFLTLILHFYWLLQYVQFKCCCTGLYVSSCPSLVALVQREGVRFNLNRWCNKNC